MAEEYVYARPGYNVSITHKNINLDNRFIDLGITCEYINASNGMFHIFMSRELTTPEEVILIDILDNGPQTDEIVASNTDTEAEISNINNTPLESVYSIMFTSTNTSNKDRWMARDSSFLIVSDEVPYLVPWDSRLVGYSFMNENNEKDLKLKIYTSPFDEVDNKNNKVLKHEIALTNCKYSLSNAINENVQFSAGDKLAVLLEPQNGSKLKNAVFTMYMQVVTSNPIKGTKDSNSEDF